MRHAVFAHVEAHVGEDEFLAGAVDVVHALLVVGFRQAENAEVRPD